jgi:hypothetical protein
MIDAMPTHTSTHRTISTVACTLLMGIAPSCLGGCVANSSNPSLSIASATIDGKVATMELNIVNPGGRDLELVSMEYQLSHGDVALPVADGTWNGSLDLKPGTRCTLPLSVTFETDPIEPDSGALLLTGTMQLRDRTGFLGLKSMNLGATPFQASAIAPVGASSR